MTCPFTPRSWPETILRFHTRLDDKKDHRDGAGGTRAVLLSGTAQTFKLRTLSSPLPSIQSEAGPPYGNLEPATHLGHQSQPITGDLRRRDDDLGDLVLSYEHLD